MWGGVAIFVAFAASWYFSIEAGYIAANHLCPLSKPKKVCVSSCDTNSFTQSYKKVPPYCNWKSISSPWWENKLSTHLSRSFLSIWLRSMGVGGGVGGVGGVGRDLVTFWLIGGALTQSSCNKIPCSPKIFKVNQIAWFFYTKCKHLDQSQNQHHDWNLLNRFW